MALARAARPPGPGNEATRAARPFGNAYAVTFTFFIPHLARTARPPGQGGHQGTKEIWPY